MVLGDRFGAVAFVIGVEGDETFFGQALVGVDDARPQGLADFDHAFAQEAIDELQKLRPLAEASRPSRSAPWTARGPGSVGRPCDRSARASRSFIASTG